MKLLPTLEVGSKSINDVRDDIMDQHTETIMNPKKFTSKHLEEYEMQAKRYKEILSNTKAGSRNANIVHQT